MSQPHSIYEYITKQLRKYIMKGWSLKILKIKLRKVLFLYQKKKLLQQALSKKKKKYQKQLSRGVLTKRYSENMQQIYRRTLMPKCDFNKVARNFIEITLQHGCSPVNLLHIFRTPFSKYTSGWLLIDTIYETDNKIF